MKPEVKAWARRTAKKINSLEKDIAEALGKDYSVSTGKGVNKTRLMNMQGMLSALRAQKANALLWEILPEYERITEEVAEVITFHNEPRHYQKVLDAIA